MSNEQKPHAAAENALHRVRELTNAVKDILRDAQGKSEFANPVRTIMKESPATCSPGDTLKRAAEVLWNADCCMVPVVDGEGRLVGVVTDRDICMTAFFRDQPLSAMDVASTMTRAVTSAKPDDSIESIVHLMAEKQMRRVPLVDGDRLVGVVSLADIARQVKTLESGTACRALAHTLAA
ncbi:MAG TPA: CBS domain-containing protein, partial [Polyangiaceae bacterium]